MLLMSDTVLLSRISLNLTVISAVAIRFLGAKNYFCFNLNYSQIWAEAQRIEQLANPSFSRLPEKGYFNT